MAGTGASSWCADDLVRIPGVGAGSKGMRTGTSAHHLRTGASAHHLRTGASAHHLRDGGVRAPLADGGVRAPLADGGVRAPLADGGVRAPLADGGVRRTQALRQAFATPLLVARRTGPGSIAPRRASTPTTARDRGSLDTGPSRHREVEQISRGPRPQGVDLLAAQCLGNG